MALRALTITFVNTTDVNGVRDSQSFLYLNTDNTGVFRFTSNSAATLTPCVPVAWQDDDSFNPSGSVIYILGLDRVLSPAQLAAMRFGSGWQAALFQDSERGRYWAVSPRTTITIAANQSIDLGVAEVNVGDAGQLPSVQIQVGYFNVGGVTSAPPLNHKTAHFTIALRKSPDLPPPPTINDQVDYRFVNGHEHDHGGMSNVEWITVTAQGDSEHINAFTLEIRPAIGKPSINAGPATYMIITFVIADGPYGALASAADLANIRMTPDEGADGWEIVHRSDVPDPYWRVAIPDGRVISGRLRLDNVVSHLDPGWSEMSIQYHNVPHFRDGQLDIPIYKYGAPVLEQGSAERHLVFLDGATVGAYLTLSWSCFSSERVHVQLTNANGYGRDLGIFDGEVGSYHVENQDWIKYLPDGTMATFSAVPLTYPFAGGSRDDGFLPVGSVPVTSTYQTMPHHGSDGGPVPV